MDETVRILLGHNEWANRVLLTAGERLPAAQFTQRFDIGFGSLHDTMRHVVSAMQEWTDRISERAPCSLLDASDQEFSAGSGLLPDRRRAMGAGDESPCPPP